MLLIPTYLAESRIHGIGVFSAVKVPKGTEIWKFDPRVDQIFTDTEFHCTLASVPTTCADKLRAWAYYENSSWILCGDNAKFFNHDEANPSTLDVRGLLVTTANRDLEPGDELTCNYKDFDDHDKLVDGPLYPTKI